MTKQLYVCGFLFDSPVQNVALMKKRRPVEQYDRLNGGGGKILPGESPQEAMVRKCLSEMGIATEQTDWHHFHTEAFLTGKQDIVYFMAAKSMLFHTYDTKTDEAVMAFDAVEHTSTEFIDHPPLYVPSYLTGKWGQPMYNLCYLIPMARQWLLRPNDRFSESV